jgi:hypothetical protein
MAAVRTRPCRRPGRCAHDGRGSFRLLWDASEVEVRHSARLVAHLRLLRGWQWWWRDRPPPIVGDHPDGGLAGPAIRADGVLRTGGHRRVGVARHGRTDQDRDDDHGNAAGAATPAPVPRALAAPGGPGPRPTRRAAPSAPPRGRPACRAHDTPRPCRPPRAPRPPHKVRASSRGRGSCCLPCPWRGTRAQGGGNLKWPEVRAKRKCHIGALIPLAASAPYRRSTPTGRHVFGSLIMPRATLTTSRRLGSTRIST